MSRKERDRLKVMAALGARRLRQGQAARRVFAVAEASADMSDPPVTNRMCPEEGLRAGRCRRNLSRVPRIM